MRMTFFNFSSVRKIRGGLLRVWGFENPLPKGSWFKWL